MSEPQMAQCQSMHTVGFNSANISPLMLYCMKLERKAQEMLYCMKQKAQERNRFCSPSFRDV